MSYSVTELEVRCGGEIKAVWLLDPEHDEPREVADRQFGADRIVSARVIVSANSATIQASENEEDEP